MSETQQQALTGSNANVMRQALEEIGIQLFPGDEHVLDDPNVLGLLAGSHTIFRALQTKSIKTYAMVVSKDSNFSGKLWI